MDFTDVPTEELDPAWMRKLSDLGYKMGKGGCPWHEAPSKLGDLQGD